MPGVAILAFDLGGWANIPAPAVECHTPDLFRTRASAAPDGVRSRSQARSSSVRSRPPLAPDPFRPDDC